MFKLNVSDRAESDFEKIIAYYAEELEMPQAATSFSDKVYKCYEQLQSNPFLYAECFDPRLKKDGFRRAIVKDYVLLFKIFEQQNSVIVYRFFHGSQNYVNLL